MAIEQIVTGITIINSLKGFMGLSLTNMDSSAESLIASGSVVEIAGAFFNAFSDTTPNASSWTAIATGATAYLALTPSGTAGSQILTASYLSTPPVWDTSKQGWYASAASNIRVVASVVKTGTTSQSDKTILDSKQILSLSHFLNWEKAFSTYSPFRHGQQVFTSSGSFIVPYDISTLYISGCATGGNGAAYGSTNPFGGGGGGGSWAIKVPFSVTPGETLIISIGGIGSNTTITGNNTFTLNCGGNASNDTGGAGGAIGSGTGAGGNGGGGALLPGSPGYDAGGCGGYGGGGGGSYCSGGAAGYNNSAPSAGKGGYGGGGGGISTGKTAGTGGPAIIIIEY